MRLSIEVNVSRLRFSPVNGRRTLYVSAELFGWHFWFQWWDAARAWGHVGSIARQIAHWDLFKSRDGLMCATAGVWTL